jgi:inosine-uridine nucleoside N-ribohydrolase
MRSIYTHIRRHGKELPGMEVKMIYKTLPKTFLGLAMIFLFTIGCGVPSVTPETTSTISTDLPIPLPTQTVETGSSAGNVLLIYDDDGSRDGMAALLYLFGDPKLSFEAINISYGEAHPDVYIQHVGRVLDDLGIHDIPLGAGQDAPLAGGTAFPDWLRQLSDNFWDFPLPNMDKTFPFQDAPELMVSVINQASEPVTIYLSGTFTNLADALRLDQGIKENIASVYFMGGAVYSPGNITNLIPDSSNRVSEWNIYADPQAAREVFESGLEMYMVPLDATNQVKLRKSDILPWHQGDEKANLAADLYDILFDVYGFESVEIFDLTAAVLMAKPELCSFRPLHLDISTDGGNTSGQTVNVPGGEPNIHVCLEPEVDLIRQELNDHFSPVEPLESPSIDPVIGIWSGSVFNNGFEMIISITIEETCRLGQNCGRFNVSTVSCSGTLTWVGMDGDLYQFQAGEKTEACGEGIDYLVPQADGSMLYISRGDYGETKGTLHREPYPPKPGAL